MALAPATKEFDAVLVPAALSDFAPERAAGKLPSDAGHATITLRALPKFVRELRKYTGAALISFKAESGLAEPELVARARKSRELSGARFVVANLLTNAGAENARVLLVDEARATPLAGTKDEVARGILARLSSELV